MARMTTVSDMACSTLGFRSFLQRFLPLKRSGIVKITFAISRAARTASPATLQRLRTGLSLVDGYGSLVAALIDRARTPSASHTGS